MEWRRGQDFEDTDVVVLFFGRLVIEKGVDVFAEVASAAMRIDPRIRALVVGDGPARSHFARRLPEAVFTGQLEGPALSRAIASADILFNPSRTEAFGNVTLEAMASGLTVVCPDAPSTRALVCDNEDGILYTGADPGRCHEILAGLARDSAKRLALGRRATRKSGAFDWIANLSSVLGIYEEVGGVFRPPTMGRSRRGG
jgi:glycosyltransferase involved in cell wall biosynthesis